MSQLVSCFREGSGHEVECLLHIERARLCWHLSQQPEAPAYDFVYLFTGGSSHWHVNWAGKSPVLVIIASLGPSTASQTWQTSFWCSVSEWREEWKGFIVEWKDGKKREITCREGEERELGQEVISCGSFSNPLLPPAKPKWTRWKCVLACPRTLWGSNYGIWPWEGKKNQRGQCKVLQN